MHETTFVNQIFSVIRDRFGQGTIGSVVGVNVRLSPLSHVSKQGLLDAYQELAKASGFAHVRLKIEPLGLLLHCDRCKNNSTVTVPTFNCPFCASQEIKLNFDQEFVIESIEIDQHRGQA